MTLRHTHSVLLVLGTLLALALKSAPAVAQITLSPAVVEATMPAGGQATRTLTVTGGGSDTLAFALSLALPPSPDDPPEAPGEVLFTSEQTGSRPDNITMTPEGRVFVERDLETLEFTTELELVRAFDHPRSAFLSATVGITHDADTGHIWWMDTDSEDGEIVSALLLEGDLDGEPTGRELDVPWADDAICGSAGVPHDAAYDAAVTGGSGLFYWLDGTNETVWAMDPDGAVPEDYPVPLTDYAGIPQPDNPAGCLVTSGLDAHTLSGAAGEASGEPLLEVVTGYPFVHPRNRQYTVVVLDRTGRNRGAETPLFDLPTPDGFGEVLWVADVLRSRLDPSVLYLTVWTGFVGNVRDWVYAVRAAPLPPVWLRASPILFEVEADAPSELTLTLDASGLAPGVYEAVASVRSGDGIGPVVAEVPVALTVTEGTDAGGEAGGAEASALSVYPNPVHGQATVEVTLDQPGDVRAEVVDVLGRVVAVLQEGPLAVGEHHFRFDGRDLPSGVYVVRVSAGGEVVTARLTLLR